ncbi:MAG: acetolactate synthase small subunit [Candidatus Hydrogenedens sp.]|nr:acetolactate synthase small subunit [Candidatus Hydrogenedentota bacterium]NLF58350.1 acetolactate synthase small subunit [Candidatus Hydrogenedens sp.]
MPQSENTAHHPGTVIELTVNNHPGVMSHITNLFARRAFNLEGILCGPVGDGRLSRMYLLVNDHAKLEQMLKQLAKLHDVLEVAERPGADRTLFRRLDRVLQPAAG